MSSSNTSSQVSPSTTSQPSSPHELRHISTGTLTPQKDFVRERKLSAQHLGIRVGSRSPTSIPSSPTSVHSSSSAIFERDIEPITPSPPHLSHPHRTPRGKATEHLDHAVPTVLDSAAAVLSSPTDDQLIAVVAPVTTELASFSNLSSRLSSRSPSPTHGRGNVPLMNLPSPSPSLTLPLPAHPGAHKLTVQTPPGGPSIDANGVPSPTPTTSYFAGLAREPGTDVQPTPTTVAHTDPTVSSQRSSPSVRPVSPLALSHPPSPHASTKRLSFLSYTDLLTSVPSSTLPLSSLTTSATVADPPPHLLTVLGIPQHVGGGSTGASPRNSFYGDRDVREGREGLFIDDCGGEWEREGMGQGLEERLESLMVIGDFDSVSKA
ncbi:hypothetical protein EDB85DRAFT_1911865 [Lactarius pseudohatsudake]|nr:hypothetical protein EDB85DRAFT_1911865 [Lactarius pseudohatsudake]